jgi:uncharacterized membrane protein SpoIIM required for sporulation
MKVAELLERRRRNWTELESYCERMHSSGSAGKLPPAQMSRFAALYRAACADLALADSYQLPQNTVQYLHRLVGRAHNQLYRSRKFDLAAWNQMLFTDVPQRIFNDRCVQLMFVIFWGFFILSAWLAYEKKAWPDFAEKVLGADQIETLETNFSHPMDGTLRDGEMNAAMAGMYVLQNPSIGFRCFAYGLLIVPGLFLTMSNAITLGASFGYMARPEIMAGSGKNFFHFVTAHGPFELTAIVLSGGAGLRLGMAWIMPGEFSRFASLMKTGKEMMPVAMSAMIMFFFAAMIEGFLSPSGAPYWTKAGVAILSSGLLAFYFVVLGFPRSVHRGT